MSSFIGAQARGPASRCQTFILDEAQQQQGRGAAMLTGPVRLHLAPVGAAGGHDRVLTLGL